MGTTMKPDGDDRFAKRGRDCVRQNKLTRGIAKKNNEKAEPIKLAGCVYGSKPRPYRTYLTVRKNENGYDMMEGACTCRAQDPCKHQYALLIGMIENDDAVLRARTVINQAESEERARPLIKAALERPERIEGVFRLLNDESRFRHRLSELHSTLQNLDYHEQQHRLAHDFQPLLREVRTLLDRDAYDTARRVLLQLTQFIDQAMEHVHDDAGRIEPVIERLLDRTRDVFEHTIQTLDGRIMTSHDTINTKSEEAGRIQEAISSVLNVLSYYAEYDPDGKSSTWKAMAEECPYAPARVVEQTLTERARNPKRQDAQARARYWCDRLVELASQTDLSAQRVDDVVTQLAPSTNPEDVSVKDNS